MINFVFSLLNWVQRNKFFTDYTNILSIKCFFNAHYTLSCAYFIVFFFFFFCFFVVYIKISC